MGQNRFYLIDNEEIFLTGLSEKKKKRGSTKGKT